MKDQFIPYNLALKLKELGFKEDCLRTYSWYYSPYFGGKEDISTVKLLNEEEVRSEVIQEKPRKYCPAPLWQQAFDWLLLKLPDYILDQMENTFGIRYYDGEEWNHILMTNTRQACLEQLIKS